MRTLSDLVTATNSGSLEWTSLSSLLHEQEDGTMMKRFLHVRLEAAHQRRCASRARVLDQMIEHLARITRPRTT